MAFLVGAPPLFPPERPRLNYLLYHPSVWKIEQKHEKTWKIIDRLSICSSRRTSLRTKKRKSGYCCRTCPSYGRIKRCRTCGTWYNGRKHRGKCRECFPPAAISQPIVATSSQVVNVKSTETKKPVKSAKRSAQNRRSTRPAQFHGGI